MAEQITMPLADAQMLLAWMDDTFGNDAGVDWQDEDAAAVGDALHRAIENFKRTQAVVGAAAGVRASDPDRFIGGAVGEATYGVTLPRGAQPSEGSDA